MAQADMQLIPMPFPLKGIHESSAISAQPPNTSPNAQNARGYDLVARRDRGCQRVGISKVPAPVPNTTFDPVDQIRAAFLGPAAFSSGFNYTLTAAAIVAGADGSGDYNTSTDAGYLYEVLTGIPNQLSPGSNGNAITVFSPEAFGVAFVRGTPQVTRTTINLDTTNAVSFSAGLGQLSATPSIAFQVDLTLNSSEVDVYFTVGMGDSSVAGFTNPVAHYLQILMHHSTALVIVRDFGPIITSEPTSSGYYFKSYPLTGANPVPSDSLPHTYLATITPANVTITCDSVVIFNHNFTTTEINRLLPWTTMVSPCLSIVTGTDVGGTSNTYDNVSIIADGPPPNQDVVGEKVVYAQGGQVFSGDIASGWTLLDPSGLASRGPDGNSYTVGNEISICAGFGFFWMVDGDSALRQIDSANNTITEPAATAGSLPSKARLLALYRGRLFHARFADDPFNFFASRSGDLLDYDAGQLDANGAFAGNATQFAGLIGDTITALVPYGDVSMIMGMAGSVAVMRGDPKSGGSIDFLSREVGVAAPNAWARSPSGDFYFLARDGLYAISGDATSRLDLYGGVASAQPKPMSRGRLDRTLGQIDFTATSIQMAWDPLELGVKILLVPADPTLPTTAVFWEQRKDAFWVDVYPVDSSAGCVEPLRGSGGPGGTLLLGCKDGWLRSMSPGALDDDGETIVSRVRYAPITPLGDMLKAKIIATRLLWGAGGDGSTASSFNVTYSLFGGDDPVSATANADNALTLHAGTISLGGYQSLDRQRSRASTFIFQLDNAQDEAAWTIERGELLLAPSGRVRT